MSDEPMRSHEATRNLVRSALRIAGNPGQEPCSDFNLIAAAALIDVFVQNAERRARSEAVRECAPAHAILWGESKWPYCICGEGSTRELHPDRLMLHLKQQAILALDKGGEE